jgi:hypothetical protein
VASLSELPLLCLLLLGLLTSGCVTMYDPEASQEQHPEVIFTLREGQTFGQTFAARRAGLDRLGLWLSLPPETQAGKGTVTLEIYPVAPDGLPNTNRALRVASFALSSAGRPGPLVLNLEPLPGPAGQTFFLSLRVTGGELQVLGRAEDIYPGGQAYPNGLPAEADMAFQLSYDYGARAFLEDLVSGLRQSWLLLPLLATLFLPGWVLLELTGAGKRYEPGERLALALGLSLSLWPVAMAWTTWIGLKWTRTGVTAAALLLLAAAVYDALRRRAAAPKPIPLPPLKQSILSLIPLLSIFAFSFGVRLVMVRDLAAPPWVDSVHHALIIRLVQAQGGYPASYAPFLEVDRASYHSGFHASAAVFQWLSGLDLPAGLLLYGQALNALMTLAVYLLALRLGAGRSGGLAAALIVGVFTPMPAYYTSWGRYTQLAALLILPAAFALVQDAAAGRSVHPFEGSDHHPAAAVLLAGLASGGLFLTHYRVAAFLGALILAWVGVHIVYFRDWFAREEGVLQRSAPRHDGWGLAVIGPILLCAAAAALLTLPWWPPAFANLIAPLFAITGSGGAAKFTSGFTSLTTAFQTSASGKYVLWLAGMAAGLALLRRRGAALLATLGLWFGLLFLAANLPALGLPGKNFINSISVEISLFMPAAVMGGFLAGRLLTGIGQVISLRWQRIYWTAVSLAALGLALAGAKPLLTLLNPATFQFRQADRPALAWIAANTPPEAAFWINPFVWVNNTYAGQDGGAWIPALAGRRTLPPPVLSLLEARPQRLELARQVQEGVHASSDPQALADFLKRSGISYVYIGRLGGVLSPQLLASSPRFEQVYAQDAVWVFKVK